MAFDAVTLHPSLGEGCATITATQLQTSLPSQTETPCPLTRYSPLSRSCRQPPFSCLLLDTRTSWLCPLERPQSKDHPVVTRTSWPRLQSLNTSPYCNKSEPLGETDGKAPSEPTAPYHTRNKLPVTKGTELKGQEHQLEGASAGLKWNLSIKNRREKSTQVIKLYCLVKGHDEPREKEKDGGGEEGREGRDRKRGKSH